MYYLGSEYNMFIRSVSGGSALYTFDMAHTVKNQVSYPVLVYSAKGWRLETAT